MDLDEVIASPPVICPHCKGNVEITNITSHVSPYTKISIEVIGYCSICGREMDGLAKQLEVEAPLNKKTRLVVKDITPYNYVIQKIKKKHGKIGFNPSRRNSY